MNTRDRDRRLAWDALGAVEKHPQVVQWLKEEISTRRQHRLNRTIWAAAACAILAVGLGTAGYMYLAPPQYETRVGEQRDIVLPDGSRITLNTDTAFTVHYSGTVRRIDLLHGEALFAAAHDPARPFEVAADGTLTQAVGTEFNVDLRHSTVTVSVLEGAVRVSAPQGAEMAGTALVKDQALEYDTRSHEVLHEKADLVRIEAWRARQLNFTDTPLAAAVKEFNRYTTTKVVLGTPALERVRVSGVFGIGDTAGFVFSLEQALGVQAHHSAHEIILARPQMSPYGPATGDSP